MPGIFRGVESKSSPSKLGQTEDARFSKRQPRPLTQIEASSRAYLWHGALVSITANLTVLSTKGRRKFALKRTNRSPRIQLTTAVARKKETSQFGQKEVYVIK